VLAKLSEQQKALVFVAALAVAIALLYASIQVAQPGPVASRHVARVSLVVDAGAWRIEYAAATTTNNTVFGLLLEASHRIGFSVQYIRYAIPDGVYVTGINGTMNGRDGRYWQYWVNGVYGDVAADHKEIRDGDAVLWRFTAPQEGSP